jgi:hypothetical protein
MPTVRKLLPIAVAMLCLLAPAVAAAHAQTAAAGAHAQTASAGNVSATLSWRGQEPQVRALRLAISQAGTTVYDQPVTSPACGGYCGPAAATVGGTSVQVLDLSGNGQLEVLVQLYSQGAHCCFIDQVFSPSTAPNGYVMTERNFENSGALLRDLNHDRQIEFVSADNAFAYEFTNYAESGLPIQILKLSGQRFVDVTRAYPALIRKDANRWWRAYRSDPDSGRVGLIAAWVADEYNLGRGRAATKVLAEQVSKHRISARFVRRLKTFLKRTGYIH